MNFKRLKYPLILLFGAIIIASCTKKIDDNIEGRWQRIPLSSGDPTEVLDFEAGMLVISYPPDTIHYDTGYYNAKAQGFSKYLEIYGLPNGAQAYEGNWFVVTIDEYNLQMAKGETGDDGAQHGLTQREFQKLP